MRLAISFEGLRLLIGDLRALGKQPAVILVSPNEKRDLKQELMARSLEHSPDAEDADHDLGAIGIIEGVTIASHKDVPRGRAWIVPRDEPNNQARFIAVK